MNSKNNNMKKKLLLRQYQNMVDQTNIVSKTDIHGRITYVNSKFIEITGYSKDELIGKSHNIIRDPDMPSKTFKDLWSTIQAKKIWRGIVSNLKKDGSKYTVEACIFPILDENDEIIEYISIRHDITQLNRLNKQLDEINRNRTEQELLAKAKLEAGIVNDLDPSEYNILYKASDIVSGDFYSIYNINNGSTCIYLIDGQGHGISPALTVFAISSMLNNVIYDVKNMDELIDTLYPNVKNFLAENEQISYTILIISPDKKSLTYSCGGMYPFLIKKEDGSILKFKANNTPFMNFSHLPNYETVNIENWRDILLYSDGIMEHEFTELEKQTPTKMIEKTSKINKKLKKISNYDFEDDVTIIHIKNR